MKLINGGSPLPIVLFSLIFFNPSETVCVPRNFAILSSSSKTPSPVPTTSKQSPLNETPPKKATKPTPQHAGAPAPVTTSFPIPTVTSPQPTNPPPQPQPQPIAPTPTPNADTPQPSNAPLSSTTFNLETINGGTGKGPFEQSFFTRSILPLGSGSDPALKKLCANTDYPSLCLSSLSQFLKGKLNPYSALESSIKASTVQAKTAMAAATKLAKNPKTSKYAIAALKDCQDNYSDALDNLQAAMDALPSKDIGTANTMLSAVITDSETCEDSFEGDSLMVDYNDKLRKMTSNCLAIASLI
ncbi:hypothetical protein UlMin_009670 [Ulmus minor]